MKKSLSFFLCLLLFAFLLFSPSIIGKGIGRNIYRIKKEEQKEAFHGTIRFWHVVSFKTPSGSGYDYLKQHCVRFERNTPYVFIELKGMTFEEAKRRMSAGEYPDVISYPAGMFYETEMLLLSEPKDIIPSLSYLSGKSLPYMMDTYVLVVNKAMLREFGVSDGFDEEYSREMFIDAYQKFSSAGKHPLSVTETAGLDPQSIADNMISEEKEGNELLGMLKTVSGANYFLNEESGMYLCPYSEYVRMKKDGLNFDAEAYFVSDETDAIQMIGVYESGNAQKNRMLTKLAEGFLSDYMQKKLEDISMLPCRLLEGICLSNSEREEAYRRICEKAVKSK